jgi:hypothetical protein
MATSVSLISAAFLRVASISAWTKASSSRCCLSASRRLSHRACSCWRVISASLSFARLSSSLRLCSCRRKLYIALASSSLKILSASPNSYGARRSRRRESPRGEFSQSKLVVRNSTKVILLLISQRRSKFGNHFRSLDKHHSKYTSHITTSKARIQRWLEWVQLEVWLWRQQRWDSTILCEVWLVRHGTHICIFI